MCGIAGFIDFGGTGGEADLQAVVQRMTDTLVHRGPDDSGAWVDAEARVALGHRRLSIIDLSPAGHQPMTSACGRYLLVYNGEIYNYLEIRAALEKLSPAQSLTWRGHSDTEVMLAAVVQWGVGEAVKQFVGMFAFALWDRWEKQLYLGRDRLGEKPLYYGWQDHVFLFASEVKALGAHPGWKGEVNRDALALYLRHGYIPTPYCIYQGISKLPPGTLLSVRARLPGSVQGPAPYWSMKEVAAGLTARPFPGSADDAVVSLEALLKQVIRDQMIADVPLGAFLSGGIDSSTVVALMQTQSSRPVKTFTIGFHDAAFNEAELARDVAQHLGTEHTELYVTPADALEVIPRLPTLYDEPFADDSQIPTFLVAQLTRQYVTVSLSGDGGDELFAGYNHYHLCRNIWRKIGWLPKGWRSALSWGLAAAPGSIIDLTSRWLLPTIKGYGQPGTVHDKLQKLAEIMPVDNQEAFYRGLLSHWKKPSALAIGSREPPTVLTERHAWPPLPDFTHLMMYLDTVSYLPDDILVKVDRASMGVSLESRAPYLDHRVVEFVWRLPLSWKLSGGQTKWVLRQILSRHVPRALLERPKRGFAVPIATWLRGPLREWAESMLDKRRLSQEGYIHPQPILQKWQEHLSAKRNWQYHLWNVLMFQAWLADR